MKTGQAGHSFRKVAKACARQALQQRREGLMTNALPLETRLFAAFGAETWY